MTLRNAFEDLATEASLVPVTNRFTPSLGTPVTASTSGDTVLHTPATGKAIRLKWLGLKAPASNSAEVLAVVKLGATEIYRWPLTNPDVFSHSSVREGAADEALILNLGAAQTVYANFDVEEFTP